MIIKQLDKPVSDNKYSQAGYKAEEQMEFYLHRAFSKEDSIFVLNGIRFKQDNDVCQIDHLVVHDYGMVIIESKSVTSKIKINKDGSWQRFWNGHYEGMRSPVIQAQMQAEFLTEFLNNHKEQLLTKILGRQQTFNKMTIDIIVAISDKGRIERSNHSENDFVFKADQVIGRIKEIYNAQKKLESLLNLSLKLPDWTFKKETIPKVADFLVANHCPVEIAVPKETEPPQQKEIKAIPEIQEEHKIQTLNFCPECRGNLSILWGSKFKNYYWHCNDCGKNISINDKCPECGERLKVRKQKQDYFIYCAPCQLESPYHSEEAHD